MTKKVLVVLTSHDKLGDTGKPTGFWLEELAAPYYALKAAGCQITLASPKGGQAPLDPGSDTTPTPAGDKFKADAEAMKALATTTKLAEVKEADYAGLFFPGGHGPLWDLVNDAASQALIAAFLKAGKPVSAVCHAPIVFKFVKDASGEFVVKGKTVTGFTNSEEDAAGLTKIVPHLVEDSLKACGGNFVKGENWAPFAKQDGLIITGQNPASSEAVAKLLIGAMH